MAGFVSRMVGASRLNVATYEEVEADRSATFQAMAVVVLSAIAAGIGDIGQQAAKGPILSAVAALVAWFLWAGLIYVVGAKLIPEPQTEADLGQLLRTLGFASAPGILRIFGFIPVLGRVIVFVVAVWMLVAMVVAVRQALDYRSTGRAIGVCLLGFVVYLFIVVGLGLLVGKGAGVL